MTNPYTGPHFAAAAKLSAKLAADDQPLNACQAKIDEQNERREALATRLATLESSQPVADTASYSDMVDALASDPTASVDQSRLAKGAEAHAAAMTVWNADCSILRQALAKIDREIEASKSKLEALKAAMRDDYVALHEATYRGLMAKFQDEWQIIRQAYIDEALLLEAVLRSMGVNTNALPQLDSRCEIVISQPGGPGPNYLFRWPSYRTISENKDERLAALRAGIDAGADLGKAKR